MPEPLHCIFYHILLNQIQLYTIILISMTRTDSSKEVLDNKGQAQKNQYQISSTIWEHNILIYCILDTEFNIILLHWNKQHFESGIIKWWCRLLNKNFHLVLMFTGFGSVQIWIGLDIEPSGLHKINQHLPSKQTSARGGKVYPYNGLRNFFSTTSCAFRRLTSSSRSML